MATGKGYGKVILFGEHYVVYGNASIASGISAATTAELVPGTEPGFFRKSFPILYDGVGRD